MNDIKIIALDLDGTLFNSKKVISPQNLKALESAAQKGVCIVPATGRFYRGMPVEVRSLPFVRYVICMNGAEVYDSAEDRTILSAAMSLEYAEEVFDYFDRLPVIYDCFQDGWGWMAKGFYDYIDDFTLSPHNADMLRNLRSPLDDFRKTLRARKKPVQKIQAFFKDTALREEQLRTMPSRFPMLNVTSSIVNNIEVNSKQADKGEALSFLCEHLNIPLCASMAFGDDLNDINMLKTAGVGVAMGNSSEQVIRCADMTTLTNDNDGVAEMIKTLVL